MEATIELLADDGFGGLSIEAVAARAGVGKTTIYRRWPSKIPLVVDALSHMKTPTSVVIPDEMTTRDALVRVLSELVRAQGNEPSSFQAALWRGTDTLTWSRYGAESQSEQHRN